VPLTVPDAAVRAAVTVAARFGLAAEEPQVLADGANVVVHLRPAPVVAKVAASTRAEVANWLQRELDVSAFLAAEGAPVVPPSPETPATTHQDDGQVMSFWRYLPPADPERLHGRTSRSSGRCCGTCTPPCAATREHQEY